MPTSKTPTTPNVIGGKPGVTFSTAPLSASFKNGGWIKVGDSDHILLEWDHGKNAAPVSSGDVTIRFMVSNNVGDQQDVFERWLTRRNYRTGVVEKVELMYPVPSVDEGYALPLYNPGWKFIRPAVKVTTPGATPDTFTMHATGVRGSYL